jgi:hypothetical protein
MPLTAKGQKILENMEKEYGQKKGEQVFYASRNKGKISGVDSDTGNTETDNSDDAALLDGLAAACDAYDRKDAASKLDAAIDRFDAKRK